MAVAPEELRETMRQWTSGIVIVTTVLGDLRVGVTVSSFTSVSLTPPLVLICLQKDVYSLEMIRKSGIFAASMLREDQANVSMQFAGQKPLPEGADRFYGIETMTALTGAPVLVESLAWVDCRVTAINDGGGSEIVVGEVVATDQHKDVMPLAYHNRGYYSLTR